MQKINNKIKSDSNENSIIVMKIFLNHIHEKIIKCPMKKFKDL